MDSPRPHNRPLKRPGTNPRTSLNSQEYIKTEMIDSGLDGRKSQTDQDIEQQGSRHGRTPQQVPCPAIGQFRQACLEPQAQPQAQKKAMRKHKIVRNR